MSARDDILRHSGVLATADAEIATLLDRHRAEALREAADAVDATDLPDWYGTVDLFENGAQWATSELRRMADGKKRLSIPAIVVLCGSTRFWDQLAAAAWHETLAGRIVVRPDVDMKRPGAAYDDHDAVKTDLDELHRAKIRLADEVLVVNPGGYIGDSTRREIAYALELGKPVRYTHPDVEFDPDAQGGAR